MKLLFDENRSPRLVTALADLFPESAHVRDLGLAGKNDRQIWDAAATGEYVIVSKDDDFHHLSFARGGPPKVIGLNFGNCTTRMIADVLHTNAALIESFVALPDASFLSLP